MKRLILWYRRVIKKEKDSTKHCSNCCHETSWNGGGFGIPSYMAYGCVGFHERRDMNSLSRAWVKHFGCSNWEKK